jgi:hypothetical protein
MTFRDGRRAQAGNNPFSPDQAPLRYLVSQLTQTKQTLPKESLALSRLHEENKMNGEHLSPTPTLAEPHERRNRRSTLKIDSSLGSTEETQINTKTSRILVGFDWGTSCSCIHAASADSSELAANESIPTIVGYAMEGIIDDLLPSNAKVLFGKEAIKNRLRLRLVKPMANGVIKNPAAAKDFAGYVRSRIDPSEGTELRAIIGLPANAEGSARENVRQAVQGYLISDSDS